MGDDLEESKYQNAEFLSVDLRAGLGTSGTNSALAGLFRQKVYFRTMFAGSFRCLVL